MQKKTLKNHNNMKWRQSRKEVEKSSHDRRREKNYNNNDVERCVMHKHIRKGIERDRKKDPLIHLLKCDTIAKRKEDCRE